MFSLHWALLRAEKIEADAVEQSDSMDLTGINPDFCLRRGISGRFLFRLDAR